MRIHKFREWFLGFVLLLGLVTALVVVIHLRRPPQVNYTAELFQGVLYVRQARSMPRPLMVHIVEIELHAPGIDFLVTPGDSTAGLEIPARTTSAFVEEFDVQVAINGSFSQPFHIGTFLWDYYPHSGDPVDVLGLAISNGEMYSDAHKDMPVLCIAKGHAEVRRSDCPIGTSQALAGGQILVDDGYPVIEGEGGKLHPRTAVAVDATGETLWLIVIDGRQRNYSEGVTLAELANIAVEIGADKALNLDGGGSSTLATMRYNGAHLLNSPVHKRIPMWERPVANHLGVYAQPALNSVD
jgi:hypothetical protein